MNTNSSTYLNFHLRCQEIIKIPEQFSYTPASFVYQRGSSLRSLIDFQVRISKYRKCVSKVRAQLPDSRTSYIASVTISASANNVLS